MKRLLVDDSTFMYASQKKGGLVTSLPSQLKGRLAAGNLAGLEATGADVGLTGVTVDHDGDTLDVGAELAGHRTVGVADGTTSNGVLTADFANFGHR